jgi:hypothetical protein
MAKMFYTMEEAGAKLGKSEDELKEMIDTGQIQEFRDRDKLMFKVDQIDLLCSTEDDTGELTLGLEDTSSGVSGSGLELADDSVIGLADSREATGISVFDTDHSGEEDVAGETQVGGTQVGVEAIEDELSLEAIGSGSGLLDLTRESDDTSLGAELLEEVYSGDTGADLPANASGLFEAATVADTADEAVPMGGSMAMPMMVEMYDGAGSGLGVGMLIGATVALVCVAIIAIVASMGVTPALTEMIADKLWIWVGGIGGITVVFGLIGLFIGKASE